MAARDGLERWRGEVTAHLTDISRRLDDLGERFEKALNKHADEDYADFDKLETRMNDVEKAQSKLAGKVAIVAGIIGAAAAALAEVAIKTLAN